MIIIPDVHGRTFWKSAVEGREDQDILFLGDYVDPYTYLEGIAPYSGLVSLLEIIDFKKANMDRVTLLLGNHDLCYISNLLSSSDRYDEENASVIRDTLLANLSLFQIAHHRTIAGISHIFSHAGILPDWLRYNESLLGPFDATNIADVLNTSFASGRLFEPLGQVSWLRGGSFDYGSCVWADVEEHIHMDSLDHSLSPLVGTYQIFGHSQQVNGTPIITPYFACLDCRKAFHLSDTAQLSSL